MCQIISLIYAVRKSQSGINFIRNVTIILYIYKKRRSDLIWNFKVFFSFMLFISFFWPLFLSTMRSISNGRMQFLHRRIILFASVSFSLFRQKSNWQVVKTLTDTTNWKLETVTKSTALVAWRKPKKGFFYNWNTVFMPCATTIKTNYKFNSVWSASVRNIFQSHTLLLTWLRILNSHTCIK